MTTMISGLRRRVVKMIARVVEPRIESRIPLARLDGVRRRLDALEARHGELEARFGELERLQWWTANELERMIPSVASQESELQAVRAGLVAVPSAEAGDVVAARSLIDEVRREHAQIRARLTGIARYEDRLRVLEDRAAADHVR